MSDNPEMNYIVRDMQRRMANMIKRGRVHSVDFKQKPPRVRVEYAKGAVTGWLPWVSGRASSKHRVDWEPLAVGEQVIILSESGELSAGVVIPALSDAKSPVPSTSTDEHVSRYEDGTEISYNRASHKLTITIGSGGDAELTCKTFHINADIEHSGNQNTSGDMTVKKSVTVTENVSAGMAVSGKSVADSVRTMSADREIFNGHDHQHGDPKTSQPNQQQ
ncbi:phage baseplate assembly protein V [Photobacterium alginatilyticum]|uniref:Phage baseplate assembly protein V n=1 Tax=Photobacterium alginatilyticum TaxID=1775171 RepID=A0ABW9YLQ7_9GAMM|nr:phage baseplate assembly protein V [Photobacterium alginatilyticum]NBI54650.1 phage baseplate assembly protein V [Photobacterium alginatilyticum]